MKLIASIIITLGLAFGTLAAATAYTVSLDLDDERLEGMTLKFGAGVKKDADGKEVPIIAAKTELTAEHLATLRTAGVTQVHLKEFRLGNWQHLWVFGLSCVGLVGGALMLRADAKRRLDNVESSDGVTLTPAAAIEQAHAEVNALRGDLPGLPTDHDRLHAIIDRIDAVQRVQIASFVEARDKLVGKYGLAGYARIMDRFAAGERQVNRSWSAAADHELAESMVCLDRAGEILGEVEGMLG